MKKNRTSLYITLLASFLFSSMTLAAPAIGKIQKEKADTIYINGNLITMDEKNSCAEAIAIKGGVILGVGKSKDIEQQFKNRSSKIVDLKNTTVLPGFIDGHSHFSQAVASIGFVDVSPSPISTGNDKASIIAALKASDQYKNHKGDEFLIAYGYDQTSTTMSCEGNVGADGDKCIKGLSHDDLDADFPDMPVILIHVSMHGGLLNKKAMEMLNVPTEPSTQDELELYKNTEHKFSPAGELTGLLMEKPWEDALKQAKGKLDKLDPAKVAAIAEDFAEKLKAAQFMYAGYGYTTVHDAPVTKEVISAYQKAAQNDWLFLDVVAYAVADLPGYTYTTQYDNHFKIAGIKIIVDGSPQGLTSLFSQPYNVPGPDRKMDWKGGDPNIKQDDLDEAISKAYYKKAQVLAHVNGDAAVQMVLDAHKKYLDQHNETNSKADRRTTPVHSQFVTQAQLESYADYGFTPSFFTNHTYFWGDLHVKNLGEERAHFLSPMKSAGELGLHMTNHSDFFVTPPDPIFILWTSVNRVSRTGKVIGEDQRISVMDGLKALTSDGAYQYHEESSKGVLKKGFVADMVFLSKDPRSMHPMDICDIEILATYKANKKIEFELTSPKKDRVLKCGNLKPVKVGLAE